MGRRSGNGVNPRVGSALQDTRPASEEEPVEVVENHEGGTRSRGGTRDPKGGPREGNVPGVDSGVARTTEGRIFGQSQERQSSRVTGWTDGHGRCRERRHRRSGGSRDRMFTHPRSGPWRGSSKAHPGRPRERQVPGRTSGGQWEADVPRPATGRSPHLVPGRVFLREAGRGAGMARGTTLAPRGGRLRTLKAR